MAKGGRQPGAGRPKGATSKPRISDYMTEKEVKQLVAKVKEMAFNGNESMIKLLVEQHFGKPLQPVGNPDGTNLTITFDTAFKEEEIKE